MRVILGLALFLSGFFVQINALLETDISALPAAAALGVFLSMAGVVVLPRGFPFFSPNDSLSEPAPKS